MPLWKRTWTKIKMILLHVLIQQLWISVYLELKNCITLIPLINFYIYFKETKNTWKSSTSLYTLCCNSLSTALHHSLVTHPSTAYFSILVERFIFDAFIGFETFTLLGYLFQDVPATFLHTNHEKRETFLNSNKQIIRWGKGADYYNENFLQILTIIVLAPSEIKKETGQLATIEHAC